MAAEKSFQHLKKLIIFVLLLGVTLLYWYSSEELPAGTITHELKGILKKEQGHCWVMPIPEYRRWADNPSDNQRSSLVLYENGRLLGPPHALHEHIRKFGEGRYSHWENNLYFSTSDNSDPNTNGRVYSLTVSPLPWEFPVQRVLWGGMLIILAGAVLSPLILAFLKPGGLPAGYFLIQAFLGLVCLGLLKANIIPPLTWHGRAVHIFLLLLLFGLWLWAAFVRYRGSMPEKAPPGPQKKTLGWLTAWYMVTLTLLGLEIVFRIFPVYDSLALNPGVKFFWPDWVYYPANNLGHRDRPFNLVKPANSYRILVVGDSYVEGAGLARKETFPAVLEEELNRRLASDRGGGQVEVYNLGHCGANTKEEVDLILKDAPILKPDLIILAYVLNDAEEHPPAYPVFAPPLWAKKIHQFFLNDLHLYSYYWFFSNFTVFKTKFRNIEDVWAAEYNPDAKGWNAVVESLGALRRFVKQVNCDCLVLILPTTGFKSYPSSLKLINWQVEQAVMHQGLQVVDILPFFEKQTDDLRQFSLGPKDSHYNARANLLIGQYLMEILWSRPNFEAFRQRVGPEKGMALLNQ